MSTLQEIKLAIGTLNPREKALLAADLFAQQDEPDAAVLGTALERGLTDVAAGRFRAIEEVPALVSGWISKS